MNQGIHTIDALIDLMQASMPELAKEHNPIAEVSAYIAQRGHDPSLIEVEDTATVSLRLQNGALGQFLAGTSMYPGGPRRITMHGRDGTIEITGDELSRWDFREKQAEDNNLVIGAVGASGAASTPLALPTEPMRRVLVAFSQSLQPGGK